jgi:hypothetical protein
MSDYPRFEPVKGPPDAAYQNYHGVCIGAGD